MKIPPATLLALLAALLGGAASAARPPDPGKAAKKLAKEGHAFTVDAFVMQCFLDDAEAVELYLAAGMSPDAADENGTACLHHAAAETDVEILDLLLRAGAKVDVHEANGDTPLCHAAKRGGPQTIAHLLTAHAAVDAACNFGRTALHVAADRGEASILAALLAAGATVDARERSEETPLLMAAGEDSLAVVKALLAAGAAVDARSRSGETPLHAAVGARNAAIAEALLAAGADPLARNAGGRSALDEARQFGATELVPLLEHAAAAPKAAPRAAPPLPTTREGAREQLRRFGITTADEDNLIARVEARDARAVALLLAAGVDPGARNDVGRPPLWEAIENQDPPTVAALIAGGADVDDPGRAARKELESGQSLVMLAADLDDPAILAALLAAGADPSRRNMYGIDALGSTARRGKLAHVELLLAAHADANTVDTAGTPVLYAAVQGGNVEIFQRMLAAGSTVGRHRELMLEAAKSPEMKAAIQAAPKGSAAPPPKPPPPPAYTFTPAIDLPFGARPVDARAVYEALLPIARAWQPDAELTTLTTTARGRLDRNGLSSFWAVDFYSPSAQKVYLLAVNAGKVVPFANASGRLGALEIRASTILDTARLDRIAQAGGGGALAARGVRPSAGLQRGYEGGLVWYLDYDDPDTGKNVLTVVIDAESGVVMHVLP